MCCASRGFRQSLLKPSIYPLTCKLLSGLKLTTRTVLHCFAILQAANVHLNRRTRRKALRQNGVHSDRTASTAFSAASSPPNGEVEANGDNKPKRLPTHQWHAKRFVLRPSAGWIVPAHAHGKGRRSRSLVRAMREAAVLQDTSHYAWLRISTPDLGSLLPQLRQALVTAGRFEKASKDVACVPEAQLRQLCEHPGSVALQCWLEGEKLIGPCLVLAADHSALLSALQGSSTRSDDQPLDTGPLLMVRVHALIAEEAEKLLRTCCSNIQGATHRDCTMAVRLRFATDVHVMVRIGAERGRLHCIWAQPGEHRMCTCRQQLHGGARRRRGNVRTAWPRCPWHRREGSAHLQRG